MTTYFKSENHRSKKKHKKHQEIAAIKKTVDKFDIIATTSNFVTLSKTGVGLIVIPIPTAIAFGFTLTSKLLLN